MGQRNRKSIVRPPIEAARWSKTSIPTAALTAALGQAIANNRSLSFTLTAPPASGNEVSDVRKTRNSHGRPVPTWGGSPSVVPSNPQSLGPQSEPVCARKGRHGTGFRWHRYVRDLLDVHVRPRPRASPRVRRSAARNSRRPDRVAPARSIGRFTVSVRNADCPEAAGGLSSLASCNLNDAVTLVPVGMPYEKCTS
jgi:hypothetical protein